MNVPHDEPPTIARGSGTETQERSGDDHPASLATGCQATKKCREPGRSRARRSFHLGEANSQPCVPTAESIYGEIPTCAWMSYRGKLRRAAPPVGDFDITEFARRAQEPGMTQRLYFVATPLFAAALLSGGCGSSQEFSPTARDSRAPSAAAPSPP